MLAVKCSHFATIVWHFELTLLECTYICIVICTVCFKYVTHEHVLLNVTKYFFLFFSCVIHSHHLVHRTRFGSFGSVLEDTIHRYNI